VARLASNWPPVIGDPFETAFLGDEEYTFVVRERGVLVRTALRRLAAAYPAVTRYDQRQHDATADDIGHIVDFLAAALYVDESQIFTDFVDWTRDVLAARGVPAQAFAAGLRLVREQLPDYPQSLALLDAGLARLDG
jgi:hypothetical protein